MTAPMQISAARGWADENAMKTGTGTTTGGVSRETEPQAVVESVPVFISPARGSGVLIWLFRLAGLTGVAFIVVGRLWGGWPITAVGGALILGAGLWEGIARARRRTANRDASLARAEPKAAVAASRPANPDDLDSLVEQMMVQGRHALLLRPQIARKLNETQFHGALEALEDSMALVPDGDVLLESLEDLLDQNAGGDKPIPLRHDRVVRVEHFFLDRHAVTNRQYAAFVAADAYSQMELWDRSIWSAILEFVDQTGEPGPRFWRGGKWEPGCEDHPVTGVCWYEAAAYARWLGKRLPTDAEWVKAASWPVTLSATSRVQHKYPWGDSMDLSRVNLWASGHGRTVPVSACPSGASVGGIHQLIGNVWEWMRGDFHGREAADATVQCDVPIKSIRGGAFDTYFDNQATCQFQSGEMALARRPNVGFRCAVSICDLLLARDSLAGCASRGSAPPSESSEEPACAPRVSPALEEVQA